MALHFHAFMSVAKHNKVHLTCKYYTSLKSSRGTNTLAYFCPAVIDAEEQFGNLETCGLYHKTITIVNDDYK